MSNTGRWNRPSSARARSRRWPDRLLSSPAHPTAASIAKTLLPGDVILLDGDLGAGKTTFTQGLARAMGVGEQVTSPTFTLVRSYPTSFGVELIHADVYRLETLADIVALGLPEMLENGAVAVIEWGERAAPALGPEHLGIRFALTDVEGAADFWSVPPSNI